MLRLTLLSAFAATTALSFAQGGMMMMVPDAKTTKPAELMEFVRQDAYSKLRAPDAYVLTQFLIGLPGNYQTALLRGLVGNAQEAKMIREKNQTAASMMAPMGDTEKPYDSSYDNFQKGERSFEMVTMDPQARVSYLDSIKFLQKDQDSTDRGLIQTLFSFKHFTVDPVMTVTNERAFDAIERYIKANAMSTQPVRLKYTSLAPRTYMSPMMPR